MSSDAVHGGSPALFYQLGLMDYQQGKTLLVSPSIYGLADPIQGTAISIMHISYSLLGIDSDLEDKVRMRVIGKYVKEIGPLAVSVQKKIKERRGQVARMLAQS
jgi:hypothetical protein